MPFLDKQMMIKAFSKECEDLLTVSQLNGVLAALNNVLDFYDVKEIKESKRHNFREILKLFLEAKQIEGRSSKTLDRYSYILTRLDDSIDVSVRDVTIYHLRGYLMDEKNRGISDRTIEGYRNVYSSFFGWSNREGLIEKNPCANLSAIKCQKKIRQPFSDVELEKLKNSCTSLRDRTIIMFLLSTGCRISEVCELDRNNIDFTNLECVVLGKGNKERTVYINNVTAMLLNNYLDTRTDNEPALFIGKGSDRLKPGGIRKMLKNLGAEAKVDNVHPHRFRRTLATNLINRGMPIQEVSKILGHENINTTMTYVYVNKAHVKSSYYRCI